MADYGKGEGDSNRFFVAVHVGAGFHSPTNEKAYKRAMKRACLAAAAVLRTVFFAPFPPFLGVAPLSIPTSCLAMLLSYDPEGRAIIWSIESTVLAVFVNVNGCNKLNFLQRGKETQVNEKSSPLSLVLLIYPYY